MRSKNRSSAHNLPEAKKGLPEETLKGQKAAEEIRYNLSLLNAALDATTDGILVVNKEGKIEKFNRKFVQMWQIPESILASKDDDQAIAFVLDQLKYPQSFLAKVKELYADPEAESFDQLEFKDGRIFERYSQPLRVGDQLVGRVWSFRDVTERKQLERKLRESEEYYRQLIDLSPEGIALTDPQGQIIFVSPKIYNIFGIPPGVPVVGTSVLDWVHPEHRDMATDRIRKLIDREISPSPFEYKLLRYDRTPFWGELSSTPLIDPKGQTKGIMTILHDVTERKLTEQSLIKSGEEAKRLSRENTILAEIGRVVSSTLNIEEIYDRFAEEVRKLIPFDRIVINTIDVENGTAVNVYMSGKTVEDRKVGDVYPLEGSGSAEMVRAKATQVIQTEDFQEYQDRFPILMSTFQAGFRSIMDVPLFSKGKIIGGLLFRSLKPHAYTENEVRLAERVGNQIAGAIANALLYAEQKQTEKALRESEEHYRDLVEFSEYLISTHDLKGNLLSVNQRAAHLLGYEQSDLINRNIRDLLAPEARDQFDQYLDTILKEGKARRVMLIQTASGEKRLWEYNNSLGTEGATARIVRSMAHDITDLKRIEKEREKLILDLQKALTEVKKLSGLLPICASCKKIRDDKGYWTQIEAYIRDHSEAEFSHGICPDCFKKLYPDIEL